MKPASVIQTWISERERDALARAEGAERDCAQYQDLCAQLISALELIELRTDSSYDGVRIVIRCIARDALRKAGRLV